jgi:putative tricarboxylic transport membrane protein
LIFPVLDAPLAARTGDPAGRHVGRKLLKDGDVISGAVLAALGVYIVMQSLAWDYYSLDGPGPGFFPFWYGVAMVTLSLLLILNVVRKGSTQGAVDWPATSRALSCWLAFALAVALMGWLGFLLSFALLTFFVVTVIFRRPLVTAGITAVLTALAFHLVFPVALSVSLPTGWFGF